MRISACAGGVIAMRSCPRRPRLLTSAALAALLSLSLAGCKSTYMKDTTGSISAPSARMSDSEWQHEIKTADARYRANPKDANAALRLAEGLRKTDQRAQAVAVLQQAVIHHPTNKPLLGAYGRALAAVGDLEQALETLGRAHTPDQPDWRILNAQGAVLDQMGRHDEARRYYATALKSAPNNPSLLSNLGLSYALSRDLKQAEEILRQADARGSSERRVRQNLALVVGLQGRFEEAEKIARADLPANEAAENITYLRQMLQQHRTAPARGRARAAASMDEPS